MGEPFGKREIFRKYPDVVDVPQLCEMLGGYRIPKVNVIRFLQNETPEDCNTVNATIDSVE